MDLLERLRTEEFFKDCSFDDLDLTGFRFAGKELLRCTFRRSKLNETHWSQARLEDCTFEDCDLSQASPGDLSATDVRFLRCKLMGVAFEKLSPSTALAFEECNLRYATFAAAFLRRATFLRCRAQETSFLECDLQDADFSGTDLTAATIQGCDLRSANLSTAEGAFVDPAKNRVKGLRISADAAAALASSFGMRVDC
ncbi:MAG: pentapeptide repeat-containing protein [Myxococcales bacterium]